MPSTTRATSQGGEAASVGSLGYSSVTHPSNVAMWGSQTVFEGLTAEETMDVRFAERMSIHREDSEVDGYPGDSPKYDDDDDEGFHTAAGFETDRASQVSGHGGGRLIDNDSRNPHEPLSVGRQPRPNVGFLDLRTPFSRGGDGTRKTDDYQDHHQHHDK